ncbi:MAG: serine hydrolase [Blastocatellia bacterium]|nr:serine hydrolase [Blastocatellia bacterium]
MKRQISNLLLVLLVALSALASAARADNVDEHVKAEMKRQRIPGVSIAVVKDGKIIKAEGYGLANVEQNVPGRPETVYKIGSVSKQLIAAGILVLVQEGRMSLDDKVTKYLDGAPETWNAITIRHLLTHTSGIVREAPGFNPFKVQTDAEVIKTAYPLPLRFAPGEKYEYCNVGYFSLAEIIRVVSGKSWETFLGERIFAPLGMTVTRATTTTEIVPQRAAGYEWNKEKLQNAAEFLALRPSGAFLSTVLDLAKWDAALYTDRILTSAMREQMWKPVRLNSGATYPYGFGWEVGAVGGHRRVQHGGSLPGFRATIARYLDDKLTVIVLTNGDNANPGRIALGIAELFIPGLIPARVAVKVDPKVLDAYTGQYQPNPSFVLTVTRDGDKLMIEQSANAEKQELLPENENRFFTREDRDQTYSFVKDEQGRITALAVQREGREVARARKIR